MSAVFALRLKSFNILFMLEVSLPMSEDAEGALSCIEESDKGGLSSTTCTSSRRGDSLGTALLSTAILGY